MASKRGRRGHVGQLFRRANRRQQLLVVLSGLVALHGLWTVFVPGVDLEGTDLPCPPALVAAFAGSGTLEITDASPERAAQHDAACAAGGRWWLIAGGLQIGVAAVWALATLEWARLRRRARRRRARQAREPQAPGRP